MIPQNIDTFQAIAVVTAHWEPTSQRLYPHPVGRQPGQRGFLEKQKTFVSWVLESSGYPANSETILTWFKRGSFPAGWEAFFKLWLQVHFNQIAA